MRCVLVLSAFLAVASEPFASERLPALLTVEEAIGGLGAADPAIVDLRDAEAYRAGHLEGAVSLPFGEWRAAAAEERLAQAFGAAGADPARPLLIVHTDTSSERLVQAAWLGWQARSRGIVSVSILEGGMKAWQQAGGPVTERALRRRAIAGDYVQSGPAIAARDVLEQVRDGAVPGVVVLGGPVDASGVLSFAHLPLALLDDYVGPDDGRIDRAGLLERMKYLPLSWEAERLVILGDTDEAAAAFWFLASEVVGIEGLSVGSLSLGQEVVGTGTDAVPALPDAGDAVEH